MNRFEALVGLNMVAGIGSIRLRKLLEFFGSPENILKAPAEKLMAVSGIGEKTASQICSLKGEDLDIEFASAKKHCLKIISLEDTDYPENLKNISDPPIILYVKGTLKPEDKFALGIVGSRRASFYGLSSAQKFAADLSSRGFTIVSGMARGIDTYAHKGALKQGGRTVAVMGSGFNHIYPGENRELSEEISASGAVVSEFSVDQEPLKQNFPRRNRVISGLSLGVLVAEAARNSGALITADFALEQGREVFALPGKVDSANSFGTNELIKQGAKLVSGVQDIIEELNIDTNAGIAAAPKAEEKKVNGNQPPDLSADERLLYDSITDEPACLDELLEKTGLGNPVIFELLLRLEVKKLIRQLPGQQFARN
ncbi:MAG: DNA-processing protein DprA [Candidatus Omnitrophica bacterium]|nr:DNA-processing protein DprA [Candidatus Omnitrophota bacterium]